MSNNAETAAQLLQASPLPPLEARVLLMHALGWRRTELITRGDEPLVPECVAQFRALQARRIHGEPIAQLTGTREFYGLEFLVTPDVLIPRPDTELLVDVALNAVRNIAAPKLLDLGTGSGAIAIALAATRPDARLWATDCSRAALAVATRNAARLLDPARAGGALTFVHGDWYAPLDPTLRFDVIVSNPPYIAYDDPHLQLGDLRFEPRGALTDNADGLTALRIIAAGASHWLAQHGALWMEHGYDQAARVRDILTSCGFVDVRSERDLAGIERVTGGRLSRTP